MRHLMGRWAANAARGLLHVLICIHFPIQAFSGEGACKRPELEWGFWLDFALQFNPGLEFAELGDPDRLSVLSEFSCAETGSECPPDHVYLFHCEGNPFVLVVFEKGGCVTLAEEIETSRFREIVGPKFDC